MFQEHTSRRYIQGCAQKIKTVVPTCLTSIASASKVNTIILIGWTCFGMRVISFTTFGLLYLFQRVENKRWQNQNEVVIIDLTASFSD